MAWQMTSNQKIAPFLRRCVAGAMMAAGRSDGFPNRFVHAAPSVQQTVDQFNWASRLPIEGIRSGTSPLFDDERIHWLLDHVSVRQPFSIFELGPLEGGHSTMLARAGATVRAVEANLGAYLKCLVVKDLLNLDAVDFQLGDFNCELVESDTRYDLIMACGVLYHMTDPLQTILNMTRRTDRVFVWTQYYDGSRQHIGQPKGLRGATRSFDHRGRRFDGYVNDYGLGPSLASFWGGNHGHSVWLTKSDLFQIFRDEGFAIVEGRDEPDHVNGPAITFLATR